MALVSLGVVASPASATTPSKRHKLVVTHGTFVGQPLVITNPVVDGDVVTFDASGGDSWSGDLTGTTVYSGHGTIDLTTGETRIILSETFTGTIDGLGKGTAHFVDYLHSGPDDLGTVVCVATGGTGSLHGVHGALQFTTAQIVDPDPYGNGTSYGDYTGFLYR